MHNKGNHKQNKKTTHRMGENISKRSDQQEINLQNIQTTHAAEYQEKNQFNHKVGRRSKETFLQGRRTDEQKAHEKMLSITIY